MTEQQMPNPIDDLFRKTFDNLPDSPAGSGWDTPSDQVWQNVQTNIQAPKKGWSIRSFALLAALGVTLAVAFFWIFSPKEQPQLPPAPSSTEQPVVTPSPAPVTPPDNTKVKTPPGKSTQQNKPAASPAKATENNTAQPLPGSKQTLPPNSTEAQKEKQ